MQIKAGRPREFDVVMAKTPVSADMAAAIKAYSDQRTGGNRCEAVRRLIAFGIASVQLASSRGDRDGT